MNIVHHMLKENTGLTRTCLEIVKYEERLGHKPCIVDPLDKTVVYGINRNPDLHCIHSQLPDMAFHDGVPKILWSHGEPLSSVANGTSMKAIVELAPLVDAFICMREEERVVWNSIKRTYRVPKGVDLEEFKPIDGVVEKLSGAPCVLYAENWRGTRNPLYVCVAMQLVRQKYPDARLHLYNCPNPEMLEIFELLIKNNKWHTFVRSLNGPSDDINVCYNRVDIVISSLYPLYARGIEALAAGRAFICPGYREPGYPWTCELDPYSMADAIIRCWEGYDSINYRKWAEERHDAQKMVQEALKIYERYAA